MALVTGVGGYRGEDAPEAQAVNKADRAANPSKVTQWQEKHQAQLDALLAPMGYRVSFAVDERTGRVICRIMDQETGEVLRQVPPEEMLALAARLDEMIGLIFDRLL